MSEQVISLRGVEVHNLRRIDLDLPRRKWIVVCGLSGSGKSSLAFDTLYAEGQRRYIETFSAYTRQFLERIEKPAADRIDGLPPAVAVAARSTSRSSRSTVGTITELNDYLRLLYARVGRVGCVTCGTEVRRESPASVADELNRLPHGTRLLLGFERGVDDPVGWSAELRQQGFRRVVVAGRWIDLDDQAELLPLLDARLAVIVERVAIGQTSLERLRDSCELALERGEGTCLAWIDPSAGSAAEPARRETIDGREWLRRSFHRERVCARCGCPAIDPEPRRLSFNSPLGACPTCEGFGNVVDIDFDLLVPDPSRSLRQGAIAPWNSPAYVHELEELLALADDYRLPVDIPFAQLEERHRQLIMNGVPEREFGGLRGFFAWLERKKYKMHIRVFLSRWRSYRTCPACHGARLRPEALAVTLEGHSLADVGRLSIRAAGALFQGLELSADQKRIGRAMLDQVRARLGYLERVGLGYLSLERTLRTLSGGELQRVMLTSALGSSLVNMLYVLDEPSIGLHPHDTGRLLEAIAGLRDRGNTVVVVEHEEAVLRAADQIVEIGPGAGERGGQVVFQGSVEQLLDDPHSITGDYLSGRRKIAAPGRRREPERGWLRLVGARGNNLQQLSVEFPLGVLCLVTGVSGSGKSTLVTDTLYPALARRLGHEAPRPADFDDLYGEGQLEDVVLVDQSPIGRSPRSNPVTYVKAFDEIRQVFADTIEAKTRNYPASHFSFNVDGGRCETCRGDGVIEVDMQFLANVYMKCPQCHGRRYRSEILDVTHRARNIADVLEMTIREAHTFFRGQPKVQARLQPLIDVGLEYLRLGQPANTLSGGEAQRLKLASYLAQPRKGRCLFLLDEPTTGLHFADIAQLLITFERLLEAGHSLIVIEHNLHLIQAADHLIDLGPGAAADGGRIVAQGTPEQVARERRSLTGRHLAPLLREARKQEST